MNRDHPAGLLTVNPKLYGGVGLNLNPKWWYSFDMAVTPLGPESSIIFLVHARFPCISIKLVSARHWVHRNHHGEQNWLGSKIVLMKSIFPPEVWYLEDIICSKRALRPLIFFPSFKISRHGFNEFLVSVESWSSPGGYHQPVPAVYDVDCRDQPNVMVFVEFLSHPIVQVFCHSSLWDFGECFGEFKSYPFSRRP